MVVGEKKEKKIAKQAKKKDQESSCTEELLEEKRLSMFLTGKSLMQFTWPPS